MFGLFTSTQKRARHDAHNWLHLAHKVLNFRRDQLSDKELAGLQKSIHDLRTQLKERADAAKLTLGIEKLEGCLRQSGGAYYPKSSLVDNVEFFLVALILFLGIRAFIIQPFKIPTNSMWPTYHGMTAEAFVDPAFIAEVDENPRIGTIALRPTEETPGGISRTARLLAFGASAHRLVAPVDGEISIPWGDRGPRGRQVSKRRWLVFPGTAAEYTIFVGREPVTVTVPEDFRFDLLVQKALLGRRYTGADLERDPRTNQLFLRTGRRVRAGENLLAFDILTGDQLFVDRMSYHFVRPKIGDGFVFRTHRIPYVEPSSGREFVDKYYIKRLVGIPGDTLEVREPVLYRNGEPIEGAAAFERNAKREGKYTGYQAAGVLAPGQTVTVPQDAFFAMGDNSPDSLDGRYWRYVPAADVVGRPLWIYYPFTSRWGPAR